MVEQLEHPVLIVLRSGQDCLQSNSESGLEVVYHLLSLDLVLFEDIGLIVVGIEKLDHQDMHGL